MRVSGFSRGMVPFIATLNGNRMRNMEPDRLSSPACGLLNVNKPPGITSRRVVDTVGRLGAPAKVGHAGTLDPLAAGVLVVAVGGATRLVQYVQRMAKRYLGTFMLGRRSVTEDVEGEVVELPGAPVPTHEALEAAAKRLVGRIEQRPPVFSALKIHGRPAYKLARGGKPVELAPRPVDIYRIEVRAYEYPELVLEIDCGGGTYVRSLGRDLAEALGTAAVMSALSRVLIGPFRVEEAVRLDELTRDNWRRLPPAAIAGRAGFAPGAAFRRRGGPSAQRTGRLSRGRAAGDGALKELVAIEPGRRACRRHGHAVGWPLALCAEYADRRAMTVEVCRAEPAHFR